MQERNTTPKLIESQKLIPTRGPLNHMWIQIKLNPIASLVPKAANLSSIPVCCQRGEKKYIFENEQ